MKTKNETRTPEILTGAAELKPASLLLALMVSAVQAQDFSIDWSTIGVVGTGTGGVYSVTGTVGQPDAGKMSGGLFSLEGGFRGVVAAVQGPAAPLLSVWLTKTNTIVISWPYPSTGFGLQQNPELVTANWTPLGEVPVRVGDQWQVHTTPPTRNRFYRLHLP